MRLLCPWDFSRQEYWSGLLCYFRGSCLPRDWTHVSCICCIDRQICYHWVTWEAKRESSTNIYRSTIFNEYLCVNIAYVKYTFIEYLLCFQLISWAITFDTCLPLEFWKSKSEINHTAIFEAKSVWLRRLCISKLCAFFLQGNWRLSDAAKISWG